uniref:Uncharacterized protein n=1 Tax=Guillardia theta TaxID=55529 RepID=A0A6U5YM60_GUITH|mmetsp:Transcript_21681/g.71726  ORF Transcript_21681/g.71726 Transcript_21681/m.71726 type:complete len:192 (+) Transcript_21681:293-868(+)
MQRCVVAIRIKSVYGELAYFKDDNGRFSSDINKAYTLKMRAKTKYELVVESPDNVHIVSMSIEGGMLEKEMQSKKAVQSDGEKTIGFLWWDTSSFDETKVSKREKLEFVIVLSVQGLKGPGKDNHHLVKTKLLFKFYNPNEEKMMKKGLPLGALKIHCALSNTSKVTSVTCADLQHVEELVIVGNPAEAVQ